MLVEFSIKNYRSIKEEQSLDFTTKLTKTNPDNYFFCPICKTNILKSAIIYGSNASGKSNIIRAFFTFKNLVINSTNFKVGEAFSHRYYDPFIFDEYTKKQPTEFRITFIGSDQIKYVYQIIYNQNSILFEKLDFYPTGHKNNLFIRDKGGIQNLGRLFIDKRIDKKLLETHLFLTKIGNSGHKQMGEVLLNFSKFEIQNTLNNAHIMNLINKNKKLLAKSDDSYFRRKLNLLIKIADVQIEKVNVKEFSEDSSNLPEDISDEKRRSIIDKRKYKIMSFHKNFSDRNLVSEVPLPFIEESAGTRILFALGGLMIQILRDGGVLFIDEFHNSLHPKLCKFLVRLFHHPKTNLNNAQLILASHETSLIDKGTFGKDQIWFTEKNQYGETELFSVKDFTGIRKNIPFSTLYKRGTFGAQPKIQQLDYIFDDEEK